MPSPDTGTQSCPRDGTTIACSDLGKDVPGGAETTGVFTKGPLCRSSEFSGGGLWTPQKAFILHVFIIFARFYFSEQGAAFSLRGEPTLCLYFWPQSEGIEPREQPREGGF